MILVAHRPVRVVAPRDVADWARLLAAVLARALILSIIAAMAWPAIASLWGWKATTVMSDSMADRIFAGDVVVSMPMPAKGIDIGRIVLVEDPDHPGRLRLHRYVAQESDGTLALKGDANPSVDSTTIVPDAVFGVAVMRSPWVGMPLVWAQRGQWNLVVATLAALGGLALISRADVHLRRRRIDGGRVRERLRRTGTRALIAGGVTLVLAVVASTGVHAAFASITGTTASFTAMAGFPCPAAAVSDSPYLYYPFSEQSGTTATDASGNGRSGTLGTGATRIADSCASARAVRLDGTTSGRITTPGPLLAAPLSFSIEAWINTATTTGGKIIGYGNSQSGASTSYDRQLVMGNDGRVSFEVQSLAQVAITSPKALNDGSWHHLVATMDGGVAGVAGTGTGMKLYVDGTLVGSHSNTVSQISVLGYWRIGYDSVAGWGTLTPTSPAFSGSLDDPAVYGTAISGTRVAAHYAAGRL